MLKRKPVKQFWFVLVVLLILVSVPSILAQKTGNIQEVSYLPAEPIILEDVKISVDIENPTEKSQNYYLLVQIVHEGNVVNEHESTFSIEKGKRIQYVLWHTLEAIGEHQTIVRLYDKLKINLLDTKLLAFNAVSHLGQAD